MTAPTAAVRVSGQLTAPVLLCAVAVVICVSSLVALGVRGVDQPGAAAAFGAVIAFGEAIRIALPQGRDSAPLASTAVIGYALCVSIDGRRTTYGVAEVIAVSTLATVLGVLVQMYAGRQARPGYVARRIVIAGFTALVFRVWLARGPARGLLDLHDESMLAVVLAAVAVCAVLLDHLLGTVLAQLERARVNGVGAGPSRWDPAGLAPWPRPNPTLRRLLAAFGDDCMATAWVCPTVVLFAVAIALGADPLGLWVLPIGAAPILVVQRSLRRYAEISATYQQTIRALSRITDLADYTENGHARRVCHLALAIGRDLSLSDPQLLDLEYAALLHDIGQLSLTDPIPGGATVLIAPERAASVASLGAAVVRQTGVLDRVADIMERQVEPYRADLAGQPVALAAAIIRTANAYDDLVGGSADQDVRLAALRRIRHGLAAQYDPRVVEALTRIVEAAAP
ncbi:MAG: HD-GYP domain-containing protein [Actinocrinis sp.]